MTAHSKTEYDEIRQALREQAEHDPNARRALDMDADWLEMGFNSGKEYEGDDTAYFWQPPRVPGDGTSAHTANCRLGDTYALELISHLRKYPGNADVLCKVAKEIVTAGVWTGVEMGFFDTLARAIVGDEFPIGRGEWVAVPRDDATTAPDDPALVAIAEANAAHERMKANPDDDVLSDAWCEADKEAFRAPVTSKAGAVAKLELIINDDSLNLPNEVGIGLAAVGAFLL